MTTIVILLLVGAVLLALETVLPGLIAGSIGILAILAAVVMAYSDFGARTGNLVLLVVAAGLIAGSLVYVKFFPDSRYARVFVSQRVIGDVGAEQPELLHQSGTALTTLRPSGMALIAGRRVDVVTEGALVEKGAAVKVVAVEGMRTVVRAV
jgi:membrane-bound serine protease (ClpP class)